MAQGGTIKRAAGPAFLSNAAANIYNQGSALLYDVIKCIRLCNVTNAAVTVSLYIGATGGSAAGTEIVKTLTIPAFSYVDRYMNTKLISTDFLTGLASAATSVTVVVETEQVVV